MLGSLIRRSTDNMLTLFPEPDSPTMPSTSPWSTVNDTPSTALTTPSSVRNETLRSLTSSSGSAMLSRPDPRVEARVEDVDERAGDGDEEGAVDHGCHDHRQVE